jgi:hypothetical protein
MTIGGLAGDLLAPSPALITLPLSMASAIAVIETAAATIPLSAPLIKPVFLPTLLIHNDALHSFLLLCLGMFFLGVYQAFAQFYRFAASEAVKLPQSGKTVRKPDKRRGKTCPDTAAEKSAVPLLSLKPALPALRAKAISLVLAGGVVAALLGPLLARSGSEA